MTEAKVPAWLTYEQVVAIHGLQLRRFGGAAGLRDELLIDVHHRHEAYARDILQIVEPLLKAMNEF